MRLSRLFSAAAMMAFTFPAMAAEHINLYTARHYEADKAIYAAFTKETGIEVKRIIAEGSALFTRLKAEGKKSPADVLLTVDAVTLARASHEGLFQAAPSAALDKAIPENLRAKDHTWYAYTLRPRVIAYSVKKGKPEWLKDYASLASPDAKLKVCTRSSSSGYSMALLTHLIGTLGEKETAIWAKGLVKNFQRLPQGNDTAQIKAVASGDCTLAIVNSYYYGKMLLSKDPAEKAAAEKVALFYPESPSVNVSAAGVAAGAPNKAGAIKFLEFLASKKAQALFADLNAENPVVKGVKMPKTLNALDYHTAPTMDLEAIRKAAPKALAIADEAGWE